MTSNDVLIAACWGSLAGALFAQAVIQVYYRWQERQAAKKVDEELHDFLNRFFRSNDAEDKND